MKKNCLLLCRKFQCYVWLIILCQVAENAQIYYVHQKMVVDNQSFKWAKYETQFLLQHFVWFVLAKCSIGLQRRMWPIWPMFPSKTQTIPKVNNSFEESRFHVLSSSFQNTPSPLLEPNYLSHHAIMTSISVLLHFSIMMTHIQQQRNKKSLRRIFSVKHTELMVRFIAISAV